jgi:hypothetical protein
LNEDAEFMDAFGRYQKQLDEVAAPVAERIVLWLEGQDSVVWRTVIMELKLLQQINFGREGGSVYYTLMSELLKRGRARGLTLSPYYRYVPAKKLLLIKQIFPPNGVVFETLPRVLQ